MTIFAALPPTPAQAQAPGATLRVLTPRQGESLGTLKFNLDVAFKSQSASPVTTAELWVDGVRWVRRDLDAPRQASTLSFEVDGTSLSAGQHTIVVKVFTANGGVSSTQVQVLAGTNEGVVKGDFGGPEMSFLTPGNGKRVSGTVELLLDAKPKNGQNPYITIYVDKQFKTLRNYPPYSYTWDTTQVSNGYHTVEASGYLDSANATTTRTMRVYVDNPGGNTVRMGDIPDLTEARNQTEANPTTAASVASRPLTIPQPKTGGAPSLAAPSLATPSGEAKLAGAGSVAADAAPAALGLSSSAAPSVARAAVDVRVAAPRNAVAAKVASDARPDAAAEKVTSAANAVTPVLAVANVEVVAAPTLATPRPVAPKTAPAAASATATAATPAPALASPVKKVSLVPVATAKPAPKAETKVTLGTPRPAAAVRPATAQAKKAAAPSSFNSLPEMANQRKGALQVAFDGQLIAFDVQPRVEAGIPIAPFRQIFEHTGGKITWAADTKVVHAVNAEREIVIAVGNGTARVNGTAVLMDRAATLENGRTIVPLSFVGKALDVEVRHDPATGRLSITSKK